MFRSNNLREHIVRGCVGLLAVAGMISLGGVLTPILAIPSVIVLGSLALLMFRGCPMCWLVGLGETLSAPRKPRGQKRASLWPPNGPGPRE
jgi:hypothetical protein